MQVELTSIVGKYREQVSELNHQVTCYKLAIELLETEVEKVKLELTQAQNDLASRSQPVHNDPEWADFHGVDSDITD